MCYKSGYYCTRWSSRGSECEDYSVLVVRPYDLVDKYAYKRYVWEEHAASTLRVDVIATDSHTTELFLFIFAGIFKSFVNCNLETA
jgi:hypothetical protein